MSYATDNPFEGFEDGTEVEVTIKGKLWSVVFPWPYDAVQYNINGTFVPKEIVQSVRRTEPEYEHGGTYRDAADCTYRYWKYPHMDPYWVGIGHAETIPFNEPVRPLRKLVPES